MSAPSELTPPPSLLRARLAFLLDAATVIAVLLLVSNVLFDGFRLRVGEIRITATSPWRTAIVVLALAAVRHWLVRRPTLPLRLSAAVRRAWASPTRHAVLPIVIASRSMVLAVGLLAVFLVGYAPKAPPVRISPNELVNLPLRWDAGWYLQLALEGYHYNPERGARRQQNVAFFPAYPLLTRVTAAWLGARSSGFGNEVLGNRAEWQYFQHRRILLAGMSISLVAFGWALVYLFRLTRDLFDTETARGAIVMASAYPYALFFSAMYTESLFLLGVVASFYSLRQRRHARASWWGLLAGLTRPNGCLLSIPLAVLAVQQAFEQRDPPDAPGAPGGGWQRRLAAGLAAAAMPGIGMLMYSAFLYQLTGRPLAWFEAHQAAGWDRVATNVQALFADRAAFIWTNGLYDYMSRHSIELLNALPAVIALGLALPVARRVGWAYACLILVMLVPPLLRGGFMSLGRVTATLFPLFIYAGWRLRGDGRAAVVVACAVLQGFLAVLFFTWRPFY